MKNLNKYNKNKNLRSKIIQKNNQEIILIVNLHAIYQKGLHQILKMKKI